MLILTIYDSDTITTQISACDSYFWLGTTYTTSGVYDSLFTNISGCDSLVILDLTVLYSDTISTNIISCDSFSWLGTTYTTNPNAKEISKTGFRLCSQKI